MKATTQVVVDKLPFHQQFFAVTCSFAFTAFKIVSSPFLSVTEAITAPHPILRPFSLPVPVKTLSRSALDAIGVKKTTCDGRKEDAARLSPL